MRILLVILLVLSVSHPAWAQAQAPPQKVSEAPVNVTVALVGTVVVAAGFGMMLRQDERGSSDTGWLIGGVAVVAAGVTLTYLGLRPRTVTVAPAVGKHVIGATATIRWPAPRHQRRP